MLLVIYVAAVGYVALRFQYDNILHEFNVATLVHSPIETLIEGLLLRFRPYNLDVLPLYIMLMALFPFMLWDHGTRDPGAPWPQALARVRAACRWKRRRCDPS